MYLPTWQVFHFVSATARAGEWTAMIMMYPIGQGGTLVLKLWCLS